MNDTIYVEEQLTNILPKTYEAKFPNLKAKEIFPVDYSDGDGVDIIEWISYDARGIAKILASYAAKDIPRVDISGKKNFTRVFTGGASFGYSVDDIRKSQKTGKSIDAKKASTALRANEELIEKISFNGDDKHGIVGILAHPNIPRFSTLKNAATKYLWKDKNPKEKLDDLYSMFNSMTKTTNELETPDSIALSPDIYNLLHETPYSDRDSTPIVETFKKAKPEIKNYYKVPYFAKAGANETDIVMMFKKDSEKISLKIPHETEFMPPQVDGLEQVVFTRLRIAGVVVFMPFSCLIGEGF
ncbi:DUF2184 domain-containing protein [Silvanigrella paludirubra]|uniref:DUF2184 domain-containing protein n=1 Tax=Silvanigrella paludirubra TaxID=2499159 RepID=A0A6N6VMQ6_9BACT|nr:major capsid family protein [Silvanigrella paludirubra]KAB8035833.1 DUF2184 domain-containing protein [Silvanigrella paludirubra]